MGLRFRRYIKLAPGVQLNVSGSGLSLRVGPRGASVNLGRRGTYANVGIPGTGVFARERLDSPRRVSRASPAQPVTLSARVTVAEDDRVEFRDMGGNLLSPILVKKLKQQPSVGYRALEGLWVRYER